MFDHSFPAPTPKFPIPTEPMFANISADTDLAFALTTPDHNPGAAMSGTARPLVLDRFATLAEAMRGAIALADQMAFDAPPQMLAILDRDDRLVLAGAGTDGAVAWCHPVLSAAEARAVVTEASQLRAQASRAADWQEQGLSQRLRQRADLLEARLITSPLTMPWRMGSLPTNIASPQEGGVSGECGPERSASLQNIQYICIFWINRRIPNATASRIQGCRSHATHKRSL